MLKGVGHKRRFQLLLLMVGLAPFLIYWLSISDTMEAASACSNLQEQYEQVGDLDMQLGVLRQKLASSNASLGMVESDDRSFQTRLLNAVSGYCEKNSLDVVGFSNAESFREGDLFVETIPVTVEGSFQDTLKLIHFLETESKTGRLISVSHQLKRQSNSTRKVLQTTIHVQNITKAS